MEYLYLGIVHFLHERGMMARLTKLQTRQIERAIGDLKRAHAYIMKPTIAIAHRGGYASTSLHYTRSDGSTLYEVTKEIGSDLVGLESGIKA
jgi:hypothetical protein